MLRILLVAAILSSGAGAIGASAQAPDGGLDQSTETRRWWLLWSETSPENRIIWAQWSLHLRRAHQGFFYDGLVGIEYRGAFAATFVTSYERRGVVAGFERKWFSGESGPLAGMLGFRAGLLCGPSIRVRRAARLDRGEDPNPTCVPADALRTPRPPDCRFHVHMGGRVTRGGTEILSVGQER